MNTTVERVTRGYRGDTMGIPNHEWYHNGIPAVSPWYPGYRLYGDTKGYQGIPRDTMVIPSPQTVSQRYPQVSPRYPELSCPHTSASEIHAPSIPNTFPGHKKANCKGAMKFKRSGSKAAIDFASLQVWKPAWWLVEGDGVVCLP